jgi:DNA repair protein RadC
MATVFTPLRQMFARDEAVVVRGPEEVVRVLKQFGLHRFETEVFTVITLNARHAMRRIEVVSQGSVDASLVHPREVFLPAVRDRATAIVVAHNHPSGCVAPSGDDLELTRRLDRVGRLLGIEVLDHIVLTLDGDAYSIRENGWPDPHE